MRFLLCVAAIRFGSTTINFQRCRGRPGHPPASRERTVNGGQFDQQVRVLQGWATRLREQIGEIHGEASQTAERIQERLHDELSLRR